MDPDGKLNCKHILEGLEGHTSSSAVHCWSMVTFLRKEPKFQVSLSGSIVKL